MTTNPTGLRLTAPEHDDAAPDAAALSANARPSTSADAATNQVQQEVSVRVLPQGHGRIYTGDSVDTAIEAKDRFPTHDRGAVFTVGREVAEALEGRGLVEIQP